ncbi:MAG: hypothetical protein ACK4ON_08290, partial [Bacteroidia bacterium]
FTYNKNATSIYNCNYGNLVLSGSVSTKSPVAALTIGGNLTVNSGVTLNASSQTINLAGNFNNSGTVSNLSILNFTGSVNQIVNSSSSITIPSLTSVSTNTVTLSTGTYNITSSTLLAGSLTINNGVTFDLNNIQLNLGGDLNNSGTISNLSDANFNGSASAQDISSTQDLEFNDLTINNTSGVNIQSGNYSITNSLTIDAGNFDVGTELLTLVYNSTKTAYIEQSNGTISGSMIIQRFISARGEQYEDLGTSVTSTTIDDWDDELYMAIGAPNDVPGFPGGDGSVISDTNYMSVYTYNTNTGRYDSVVTGTTLIPGQGYTLWLADDKTSFPGRAIDTRGTPNMGTVSYNAQLGTDPFFPGWNLISNPHASWIDWAAVVTASGGSGLVDPEIQIYDGSGNYVNQTNPQIAPGQGFWCFVYATTNVNFPQSAKVSSTSSSFMRRDQPKDYDLKL